MINTDFTHAERAIYISIRIEISNSLGMATDGDSGSFHKYEWFPDFGGPVFEKIEIDNSIDREIENLDETKK